MQATIVFQKNWDAINARNEDGSRKYRYIINTGSSRSSKTYSLLQSHYLTAFSKDSQRISIWRETKQDVKNTVLSDFKKALLSFPMWESVIFNKTESIYTFPNRSTLEICGGDDTNKVHGFQGDVAHFNEPYKMPKEVFDQIDMRTSDYIVIDWNPRSNHWIDDLSKQDNAIVIHSTFKDNPFVPEQQRLKILSYEPTEFNTIQGTANEWMWQVYGLGLKAEKPNRILSGWKKIPRKQYDDLQSTEYIGNDWGKNHNWGILGAKYYDGALYLREMNYASEVEIMKSLPLETLQEFKKQESKEGENLGIVSWMFAKLGINKKQTIVCDNNRPLKISMLRRCGWDYAVGAQKGQGSIKDGLDLIENIEVYYTDDSPNLSNEYENYSYIVDRYGVVTDEPEDANNHLIDPARYICQLLVRLGLLKRV